MLRSSIVEDIQSAYLLFETISVFTHPRRNHVPIEDLSAQNGGKTAGGPLARARVPPDRGSGDLLFHLLCRVWGEGGKVGPFNLNGKLGTLRNLMK